MVDITSLSPEERKIVEARREYQRKWRAANKDKVKKHNKRFYEKLAAQNKKVPPADLWRGSQRKAYTDQHKMY